MPFKVLITDYAWASLDPEREILDQVGAELVVASSTDEDTLAGLAADVDAILTCWANVSGTVIAAAPRCLTIGRYGIGLDNIDLTTATANGIVVTNVPAYCLDEVADHTLALGWALGRKLAIYSRHVQAGVWDGQVGYTMRRLTGQTLGLVGFGKIARRVARKATGLGLNVVACSPSLTDEEAAEHGVTRLSFDQLLATSDMVSLHCPLTEETQHLIDAGTLGRMKSGAFLINTSRGGLVDLQALLSALESGQLQGAALDVMPTEPPDMNEPLFQHPNVIVTPHVAFASAESILELQQTAARQVADVFSGRRPANIVNPQVLTSSTLRARIGTDHLRPET